VLKDLLGEDPEQQVYTHDNAIPLSTIDSETFSVIKSFCIYHEMTETMATIPMPLTHQQMSQYVNPWYTQMSEELNRQPNLLFKVITAANFLNILPLLALSCATLAMGMMNKNAEEIRRVYNIVDDLTEQEKEEIRSENQWINDL